MENKLGVSNSKLFDIERKIVNFKLNLLDEYITFNKNIFEFQYLIELHKFLFSDLYFDKNLAIRNFDEVEINNIETILVFIENVCINNRDRIDELLSLIYKLWEMQPFQNGNTRTLIAYLYILNKAFLLNMNIELNSEISNKTTFFELSESVNQNRLTKTK